jgi:hypothetical protein
MVIKRAEWTLTEDNSGSASQRSFRVICLTCAEGSPVVEDDSERVRLEDWALEHTGRNTEHRKYELTTQSPWRVDPAPGNPLYREEKESEVKHSNGAD